MKDYFDPKSNIMISDKIAYEEKAKKPTVIIEEYANVDETFQNIKNIKVGSMTLNDLFGDNLKVIEKALEERKELLKWKDSQQELIKGKDEYIAKLCNDRAELKEELKQVEDFKYHYDRYKKELANNLKTINCMQEEATTNYNLIEQLEDRNDRLVKRLEKQKAELNDLREFAKVVGGKFEHYFQHFIQADIDQYVISETYFVKGNDKDFDLVKKVVEKYGK